MRRTISLVSALLIAGLCVAVAMQAREIARLHREVAVSHSAVEEKTAVAVKEQQQIAKLTERNEAYKIESEGLRARLAGAPVPAAPPARKAGPAADPAKAEEKDPPAEKAKEGEAFGKALGKMFSDPEMKKVMRAQQAMAVRMLYGDVAKELGLTPEENDRVMNVLGERQADMAEMGMAAMSGDKAKADAATQSITEATKKSDAELKEVLGDKYDGFKAYEKSIGDRMALTQYQQQFAGAGQPLDDNQRAGLLQIMTEERQNMPKDSLGRGSGDVQTQMKALSSDETLHSVFASQEELNRRVLARAGTVLSPEQLSSFAEMQGRMLQMQQMGLKMSRTMMGGK